MKVALLQIDPTAAIAPAADLVAWSRLGAAYRPEHLKRGLEQDRTLFEHDALVRPMSDAGLVLSGAADFPRYERRPLAHHPEKDRQVFYHTSTHALEERCKKVEP